jgi:hypothetical protein
MCHFLSTWRYILEVAEFLLLFGFFVFFFFLEIGSFYVVLAGLKLPIVLLLPPKYWDYKCAALHLTLAEFFYSRISMFNYKR